MILIFDTSVLIDIDNREKSSLIPSLLIKNQFPIEFKNLPVADYLINNTAIERKTISDLKSSIINKSLIGKNSSVKCQGKIIIPKTSVNCNSQQKFEALFLDNTSKCEASPILEIFNDQVSCSHSATISYINQEKLYYLNSRGLDEKKATELLLEAFAETILKNMPEEITEKIKGALK